MKKIIRKVVVAGMALAMVMGTMGCGKTAPAEAQEEAPIAGGWEAAQDGTITEELQALFDSWDIDITTLDESELNNASYFGRIFARSGGLRMPWPRDLKSKG